jgi:hypothetical protein
MELGKIKIIKDLRSVWKNEANDFTKWLAQEDNINLLGDELGLSLQVQETEAGVGSYRLDILASEISDDNETPVIIENQLESTNHDHLGKIITYASGYDAKYIIWIVRDAREEHIQAINWLNDNTDENRNFFLVKIELWQIENSLLAPKFQIICRPNGWGKTIRNKRTSSEFSNAQMVHYSIWSDFRDYALSHKPKFSLRSPSQDHWYDIAVGRSGVHLALTAHSKENLLTCQFYISDDHNLFHFLEQHKNEITQKIGIELNWNCEERRKACYIETSKKFDTLVTDDGSNRECLAWLYNMASKFYEVFPQYLKKYTKN